MVQGSLFGFLMSGIIGAAVAVTVLAMIMPKTKCPECGEIQPKFRKPQDLKQALMGGWTCVKCGCEVDGKGNKTGRKA